MYSKKAEGRWTNGTLDFPGIFAREGITQIKKMFAVRKTDNFWPDKKTNSEANERQFDGRREASGGYRGGHKIKVKAPKQNFL